MLRIFSQFDVQVKDRQYHFNCSPDSPLEDAKEACFQVLKMIGQIEDQAKEQIEEQKKIEEEHKEQQQIAEETPNE